MKKYFLLLFITTLSLTSYAQNTEMAKAFYKKALQAYEDDNYEEALKLIEKTKENLNGNTNPDIIFIEAKARFENDLNINKAKDIFNQFLKESSDNDERRKEVSNILVDIETSDKYHKTGFIKLKKLKVNDNQYNNIYYRKDGIISKVNSFFNDKLFGVTHYNKQGERIQYYEIYYSKDKRLHKSRLKNNYVSIIISYKELNSEGNQDTYFTSKADYFIPEYEHSYKNYIQVLEYYGNKKNGLIKTIRIPESKRGWRRQNHYTFDSDGIPIRKERIVRGEIESTYTFNKETKKWIKE
jgi:hypothetical protein